MLCYIKFLSPLCGEEHQHKKALFFSFLKQPSLKNQKKIISISYLIMVLINMRLLIFLVLTLGFYSWFKYGLARRYGIMSQI